MSQDTPATSAPGATPATVQAAPGALRRLSQRLMPDYNRAAASYWWTTVGLGTLALAAALLGLAALDAAALAQVAAGVAITVVAGIFPVRIARSAHSVTVGEIFIFLLLLLHGPAPAVVAASADAAVASWRTSRRWTSRLASPATAALAMSAAGHGLHALLGWFASQGLTNPGIELLGAMVFALAYFTLNALLISLLPLLKQGQPLLSLRLFGMFGWVGIVYAGSAAVAVLLALTYRQSGIGVLAAVVPLIAMMVATLHYFFRQQEADAAMRKAAEEAAEREAALAARHLKELHHIAFHDTLTGLPNRRSFQARLDEAVARCGGRTGTVPGFAVMFLDFDRFKLINDSLGHAAGDDFLVQVAARLQSEMGPQDLLARLGGDEFAVLMTDPPSPEAAAALAARLNACLHPPFQLAGSQLSSSASIGITTSALPYTRPEDVLRDADIAMYHAKAAGRARHVMFDARLHAQVVQRLRLENDLRDAIAQRQISVHYQPIFDLSNGRIVGFEALARWQHPELGRVSPETFVAIASEAGLATELTDTLVQQAVRALRRWQRSQPAADTLAMHVNISGRDLVHSGLADRLLAALNAEGLQPRHLRLELDENTLMQHIGAALPVLAQLRAAGIGLSLDDFGSGFSSLKHLHSLPIDSLKIDPSFVQALQASTSTAADAAVVRAVVELGRSLGKSVIAEGIETASQLVLLRAMGCLYGQGYHLAPPLGEDAVPGMLAQSGPVDATATRPLTQPMALVSSLRH